MNLKDILATHLLESGESVDGFAARAGVSRATVYRVKSGDYGDYTRIKRIINALGQPVVFRPDLPDLSPTPQAEVR